MWRGGGQRGSKENNLVQGQHYVELRGKWLESEVALREVLFIKRQTELNSTIWLFLSTVCPQQQEQAGIKVCLTWYPLSF